MPEAHYLIYLDCRFAKRSSQLVGSGIVAKTCINEQYCNIYRVLESTKIGLRGTLFAPEEDMMYG